MSGPISTRLAALSVLAVPLWSAAVCELKARGDGQSKDTTAFQLAIDQCAHSGGGVVRVPPGTYLLTPLTLKSHITLELAAGAVLKASDLPADYPITGETMAQGKMQKRPAALLSTLRETGVTIRGEGVIDGSGESWWKAFNGQRKAGGGELPRPWLLQFSESDHVTVEGITLRNAPSRPLVPYYSTDVTIRNVKIYAAPDSPNTDGISVLSSHRVRIEGCTIDTGSDNILISSTVPLTAGLDSSSSDITVSQCTLLRGKGASIGADTGGGIHHVTMEDLHFRGTSIGIRIKAGRGFGGDVSDISYRNIDIANTGQAINISSQYPGPAPEEKDTSQPVTSTTPNLHNITLTNIDGNGNKSAGLIIGLMEQPIQNLVMTDVRIAAETGLRIRNANVTLRNTDFSVITGPALLKEKNATLAFR